MTRFAEVAVDSPAASRRTFSYEVPQGMAVEAGHAVWVPFGPRRLQGIVWEIVPYPAVEQTRPILELLSPRPLLAPYQLKLARWLSDYYFCPLFPAVALMLPPGFQRRLLTFYAPSPQPASLDSLTPRSDLSEEVWHLLERRGRVELGRVRKGPRAREVEAILSQMVRRGLALRTQEVEPPRVREKIATYLKLALSPQEAAQEAARLRQRRAPHQARLLEALAAGPLSEAEARRQAGASRAAAVALREKGLVLEERRPVLRDPMAQRQVAPASPPTLTPDQEAAWGAIQEGLLRAARGEAPPRAFLLHGVTGSGKTELYLRALAQAAELGRRGIVLVPEIALTPQTIERFASRFPGQVAVLHSGLSLGEQFDEWHLIREGRFQVVVGSRGAVFAPQPDLGLIVLDEEHEWSYKQEVSPRYHAREVALKLAELTHAVVILGSATPDVETYYRAERGEFIRLEMPRRVGERESSGLPQVEVVDLRQELKAGNRSIFSRALREGLEGTLKEGGQAILFLNRRGSASFVQCRDCGHVLTCRRCALSLTYHGSQETLVCHQCYYRTPPPTACPQCLSPRIKYLGLGTEGVEAEARRAFPQARLLRWDRDVARGRGSHERLLSQFRSRQADILIGTQMVAKGLHLPEVTLVGVVSADVALYLPHFRAGERTFQLLTQVAGRAGRGPAPGRVVIHTYTPDHYAVAAAAHQDYALFYRQELELRRHMGYPPFSRLLRLLYSDTNPERCQREAQRVARLLRQEIEARGLSQPHLLGPTPAYIQRLRGRYRWQLLLRGPEPHQLLEGLTLPQGWAVDVDPVDLL